MDAITFIKERERMCEASGCILCPASLGYRCGLRAGSDITPDQQVNIVKLWAKKHPRKTRLSLFFGKVFLCKD